MLEYTTKKIIDVNDFDDLVQETYGRPYSYQQQDGCKDRGVEYVNVPFKNPYDFKNDSIPEIVNGNKRGVSFKAWLERDPEQKLNDKVDQDRDGFSLNLWWERNFYPSIGMVINDLYEKGLIEEGEYVIEIDW